MSARRFALATFFALACACVAPVAAHEGHDHAAPEPVAADPNLVVRSVSNDRYEVVLKYASEHGHKSTTARVYISDFATNAPVDGARVTLRTTSPRQTNATATAVAPGVYEAEVPFESAGRYTLILAIATASVAEFAFQDLPMGEELPAAAETAGPARGMPWWLVGVIAAALLVTALLVMRRARPVSRGAVVLLATLTGAGAWRAATAAQEPAKPTAAAPRAQASATRYMPKESQFLVGVRTVVGRVESLRARVRAVGHVEPESGALASVEAPQAGKLEQTARIAVGDRVRQGQVIAHLLVIDQLPIRAPISGLVAEVKFSPGQWVQAGDPLLVILDERRVRVELPLFGENLNRALRARAATITTSALPGMQFDARVRGLAPTVAEPSAEATAESRNASPVPPLLLTVDNRGGLLRPGMLVEASLELPTSEEMIAVPESAVIPQEAGASVFVHTAAEVFEQRAVRVMGRYGERVGIAGDVRPGDRIVVEGALALVSAPPVVTATDSVRAAR